MELAYDTAIDMLNRDLLVTCVPGQINGHACVRTAGIPIDNTARLYLHHRLTRVRLGYLYGAMHVNRRQAQR